jgi:hypothetical protein
VNINGRDDGALVVMTDLHPYSVTPFNASQ